MKTRLYAFVQLEKKPKNSFLWIILVDQKQFTKPINLNLLSFVTKPFDTFDALKLVPKQLFLNYWSTEPEILHD